MIVSLWSTKQLFQPEKISEKQPVFKDKSDDNKKVAIVRRTLI